MRRTNEERLAYAKSVEPEWPEHIIDPSAVFFSGWIEDGFGYAREKDGSLYPMPHRGNVVIGKKVVIRKFVTIDRAVNGSTIIGDGTKIDHHCHIAHGVKIGKHNSLANGCSIEGSCEIGDFNTFGSMVVVQTKVKIGSNCIIGSGSVVTKDIPDGEVWVGNPARKLKDNLCKY